MPHRPLSGDGAKECFLEGLPCELGTMRIAGMANLTAAEQSMNV